MNNISVMLATLTQESIISSMLEETRAWLHSKGLQQWILPFTSEWVRGCIERHEFYLASIDQQAVGVFRLIESDPTIWEDGSTNALYLHSFTVRRNWTGQEIGRSLLQWAEEYTAKNHRQYLRLDCMAENPVLCAYYKRAGFISCGIKEIHYRHILWKAQLYQKEVHQG